MLTFQFSLWEIKEFAALEFAGGWTAGSKFLMKKPSRQILIILSYFFEEQRFIEIKKLQACPAASKVNIDRWGRDSVHNCKVL